VKILLDEQLDTPDSVVGMALNAFASRHGCTFVSLQIEAPGLSDPEIPGYCRRNGIAALVSANVKDFGARLVLYEALLRAGISVVVLRPGKVSSLRSSRPPSCSRGQSGSASLSPTRSRH
jgi:hypothetical protein